MIGSIEKPIGQNILKDEIIYLGSKAYLISWFRLVTVQDEKGRIFQFVTNRMDISAKEISDMYHARWQIELSSLRVKRTFVTN